MAARRKAPRRPSLAVVITLGVLTALAGAALAFASLASQPVQEVRVLPGADQRQSGAVYYIKGSMVSSPGWRTARAQLARGEGGSVRLTEADLNSWADYAFRRGALAPGDGEEAAEPSLLGLRVEVTGVNFRILEEQVQIGAYVALPGLFPGRRFTYQVRGQVEARSGGGLAFDLEEGTFGRAPVGRIPLFGSFFHHLLVGLATEGSEPTALQGDLATIDEVEVSEGSLVLNLE